MENENRKGLSKTALIVGGLVILMLLAVIAALLLLKPSEVLNPELQDGDGFYRTACPLSEPVYPEMPANPMSGEIAVGGSFEDWEKSIAAQQRDLSFAPELKDFFINSLRAFLEDSEGENRLISPLDIYMSLSMLSELSGGDSRQEILDALNCPDMETLRSRASDLWNAHYRRDGATSLVLANSLWLKDGTEYNSDTLKSLAEYYYASSFSGIMGSDEYNKLLQNWLSQQTEGLLDDAVGGEGFDESTIMALASSICFRAKWNNEFSPENTAPAVFHGAAGDRELDFMNKSFTGSYYWGNKFGAVKLPLQNGGGSMYLLLPDEDSSCDELLGDDEAMDFIFAGSDWDNSKYLVVNLSMPKFDVSSSAGLKPGFNKLGIESVFSENADFSPLCDEEGIFLSDANHSVRVAVDEEGVTAAAYTVMQLAGSSAPPEDEVDFILDRPFIFVIQSESEQPLFAGVINEA